MVVIAVLEKTDDLLKSKFSGIPRCVIQYFISICPVCNLKKTKIVLVMKFLKLIN